MASSTCSRGARGKGPWCLFLALMGTWASRSRRLKWTAVDQTAALQLPASSSLSTLPLLAHHSVYYHHRKPFSKYSPTKETSGLQLLPPLEMFLIFWPPNSPQTESFVTVTTQVDTAPTSVEPDSNRTGTLRTLSGRTQGVQHQSPSSDCSESPVLLSHTHR